jgi:hypothetical protein
MSEAPDVRDDPSTEPAEAGSSSDSTAPQGKDRGHEDDDARSGERHSGTES